MAALIISGEPTLAELSEAWANIYSEYIEKNQGNSSKYIYQLQSEIILLSDEIDRVETSVELLSRMTLFHQADIELIAKNLRVMGYDFPFDADDEDGFQQNLMICTNRIANKKFKLEAREKELKNYLDSRKEETINENYFSDWLRRLTKYLGIRLQKHDTTVDEFIGYQKDYLDEIKRQRDEIEAAKIKRSKY